MIQAQIGELLVGSYLRLIEDCELVSYNQRSKKDGHQMEVDVIGVESSSGTQTVYACEVVTHLRGMQYSGTPDTNRWAEYGGDSKQFTLEKLWHKFCEDYELITEVFDDADEYVLQLWSPVVRNGYLTDGLAELQREFEKNHDGEMDLVINGAYADRVDELREKASETEKSYDEPAFRFLQILEHLREDQLQNDK